MSEKKGKLSTKLRDFFKNRTFKKTGLIICLSILLVAIGIFAFNFAYKGKIFPRTYIGGINLGGKTQSEAWEILKNQSQILADNKIELKYLDQGWTLKAQDIELQYDGQKSAEIAWQTGREGSFFKIAKEQLKSIFSSNRFLAYFSYDKNKFNTILMEIAGKIDVSEKDATVAIEEDLRPQIKEEQTGLKFSFFKNQAEILKAFGNFKESSINLAVEVIRPKITKKEAEEAKETTQKILKNEIAIKAENKNYTLEPQDFASWLLFVAVPIQKSAGGKLSEEEVRKMGEQTAEENQWQLAVQIDPAKSDQYVASIASEIYQEPKDAKFEVQSGKVVAFQLSQTGYELDKNKAIAVIGDAIFGLEKEVELPIKVTEPEIASNSADKLGIKELVGEGTTDFSGSPQNRRHNIAVGAQTFHGVLLKPGEEFSMLKYLGQVDASTGYLPELVIKEDRTVPEYGGGLCQVSTTMFRATLNAGFKITERQNHSYRVRYYEPPVGMDATIYNPKPDFKFVNDLQSYVLIQAEVGDNDLTFRFYGTSDGRKVETTEPYVYDVVGAGEPIYSESADLAPGEIKKIESAHPGSKATFTYRVYDAGGKLINEQKFDSYYTPWPARYLYGPGTQIPPPE